MITQHPNGNSYLFVDDKVFVSAYNPQTNSVITIQLDLSLSLNDWEKEQIKLHIGDIIPDGFKYIVVIHSYGSYSKYNFSTLKEAINLLMIIYENNGFADLYTNNPKVNTVLSRGCVYYLENCESLSAYKHPKEAKIISNSIV